MILHAVGAISVDCLCDDFPCFRCVSIFFAVAALSVGMGPLAEVDGFAVPRHLGVELIGEGIRVEAFGKEGDAGEAASGLCGCSGHSLCVVVERRPHGGSSAELP